MTAEIDLPEIRSLEPDNVVVDDLDNSLHAK